VYNPRPVPVALFLVVLAALAFGCASKQEPRAEDAAKMSAPRADPEEGPPKDPAADPLLTAATRICRLVDHKDEGVLAVAFVPEFFDTTSPAKLDAALHEVRQSLGRCKAPMTIVRRASPLEGVVAIECDDGVLVLSIGLSPASNRPMMTLDLEMQPLATLHDVQKPARPK
jgi:hypothetical protein